MSQVEKQTKEVFVADKEPVTSSTNVIDDSSEMAPSPNNKVTTRRTRATRATRQKKKVPDKKIPARVLRDTTNTAHNNNKKAADDELRPIVSKVKVGGSQSSSSRKRGGKVLKKTIVEKSSANVKEWLNNENSENSIAGDNRGELGGHPPMKQPQMTTPFTMKKSELLNKQTPKESPALTRIVKEDIARQVNEAFNVSVP